MNLTAKDIRVRAGGKEIVRGASFALTDGDWLMIVGPNGAGKTTLVRALCGGVPCEGEATIDGEALSAMRPALRARRVGLLDQQTGVTYAFSVEEVVRLGRYAYRGGAFGRGDADGERLVEEALHATGLYDKRRQSMLTLSGGERQRAFLAQALCQDPSVLILDEPGNHLDLAYQRQLYALLDDWRRRPGKAVISVMHDLALARRYGTRVLLMERGAGSFGTPREVLTREALSRAFGMDVCAWMRDVYGAWEA